MASIRQSWVYSFPTESTKLHSNTTYRKTNNPGEPLSLISWRLSCLWSLRTLKWAEIGARSRVFSEGTNFLKFSILRCLENQDYDPTFWQRHPTVRRKLRDFGSRKVKIHSRKSGSKWLSSSQPPRFFERDISLTTRPTRLKLFQFFPSSERYHSRMNQTDALTPSIRASTHQYSSQITTWTHLYSSIKMVAPLSHISYLPADSESFPDIPSNPYFFCMRLCLIATERKLGNPRKTHSNCLEQALGSHGVLRKTQKSSFLERIGSETKFVGRNTWNWSFSNNSVRPKGLFQTIWMRFPWTFQFSFGCNHAWHVKQQSMDYLVYVESFRSELEDRICRRGGRPFLTRSKIASKW